MSYVLDALRRADAERGQGQVPDLHARPAAALGATAGADDGSGRPRWPALAAGAAAVLALLVLGWAAARWSGSAPGSSPAADQGASAAPARMAAPAGPPPAAAPTTPTATAPTTASAPAPTTATVPVPSPAPAPTPQVLIRIEAPAAPPARANLRPPPSPAPAPVRLRELPDAERRAWPALSFGGAMDSPVAAHRMLIVNGEVLREGDAPLPGLVLERIQLRSAVFVWRGRRVEVEY